MSSQRVTKLGARKALRPVAAVTCLLLLAAPAWAAGGNVTGTVVAMPAKYLPDTVVYLKNVPGTYPPEAKKLDQKNMTFLPRILTITQGDTVEFLNHDTVAHNVFSPDHEAYNLGVFKPGESRSYTFKQTGAYTQLCSLHPEMLAYIFVGQNPYAAVVDAQGQYTLKDVPAGSYELEVWNPELKASPQTVTVVAGQSVEADFAVKR